MPILASADLTQHTILAEHAGEIRVLGKRAVTDVIEIGRRLTECKRICGHGNWLPWFDREFGWTEQTALSLDWLIVGGESGPRYRHTDPDWIRPLRDQCARNGIVFHFKQWGGVRPKEQGCRLDGREHKGFPAALIGDNVEPAADDLDIRPFLRRPAAGSAAS